MGPRLQSQLYAKWRSKREERELPQARAEMVGNETHLVLLRYKRLWSIHLSQLGELQATPNPTFPDSGCLGMWP